LELLYLQQSPGLVFPHLVRPSINSVLYS
jgi:hypothetical protein